MMSSTAPINASATPTLVEENSLPNRVNVLSAEDPKTGLMKMAIDIAKSVFRNLAVEGIILGQDAFGSLLINYQRTAKDMIKRYRDDAAINGLGFDYHQESIIVEAFTQAIQIAGQEFMDHPLYSPLIPSWNRVTSAIPDFLEKERSTRIASFSPCLP